MTAPQLDDATGRAVRAFLDRIKVHYPVIEARLFGSRARGEHRPDSDADVAVVLQGTPGTRVDVAVDLAGVAFDVMLETGVLVEALPLWETEWAHPDAFENPSLLSSIRREGIPL